MAFRAFGTIPGPIVFGAIFDSACIYWQYECGRRGNCWVYHNQHLSERAVILALLGIATNFIFSFLTWLVYPKKSAIEKATTQVTLESSSSDQSQSSGDRSEISESEHTILHKPSRLDSQCSQNNLLDSQF